jgi:hypothetical protein
VGDGPGGGPGPFGPSGRRPGGVLPLLGFGDLFPVRKPGPAGVFSEALSGHPEVSTLPGGGARLFPDPAHRAEEAPFYRLGWEAVLFALSALDRGELPEEDDAAVRFALAGGRRAAGG